MWALDLASQVPAGVQITCTDISPHLFPKFPPANAHFAQHSVLALPADWAQRFNLVNQNLLIWALRADEWPRALGELFRVTKPGGWAQLCELDWPGVVPADGPNFKRIKDMNTQLALARGFDPACAAKLEEWFKEAGFVNVQAVRRPVPMGAQTGYGVHNATDPFAACFSSLRVRRSRAYRWILTGATRHRRTSSPRVWWPLRASTTSCWRGCAKSGTTLPTRTRPSTGCGASGR